MTTTSNIRRIKTNLPAQNVNLLIIGALTAFALMAASAACIYWLGHSSMQRECASIMTAGVPIPPAPVVYLSRGE